MISARCCLQSLSSPSPSSDPSARLPDSFFASKLQVDQPAGVFGCKPFRTRFCVGSQCGALYTQGLLPLSSVMRIRLAAADVMIRMHGDLTPFGYESTVSCRSGRCIPSQIGLAPLSLAARCGHAEALQALLDAGTDRYAQVRITPCSLTTAHAFMERVMVSPHCRVLPHAICDDVSCSNTVATSVKSYCPLFLCRRRMDLA